MPQRDSVREWECVNMSTSAALGFCLSAAGTSFTDQEDESWGGRVGCLETRKLMRTERSYQSESLLEVQI